MWAGSWMTDELIVARHVTAAGRSRAYLGGAQVPAGVCAELTAELVRIYGQAEQERLTEADRQRELLDRFAGAAVLEPLARYSDLWSEDRAARTQLAQLRAEAQSRAREIDLLRFGLEEIERIGPNPGRMSRWRQRRSGCSPRMICGSRHSRLFTRSPAPRMRLGVRWRCCTRRARHLNQRSPGMLQRRRWVLGWRRRATSSPI